MKKLLFTLCAAASVFCTACHIAPMFNAPDGDRNVDPAIYKDLPGTWQNGENKSQLIITTAKEENNDRHFSGTIMIPTEVNGGKDKELRPLPVLAMPVKYNNELFFIVMADTPKIISDKKYAGLLGLMIRPYFYLCKLEFADPNKTIMKISMVKWTGEKDGKQNIPVNPDVKVTDEGIVMNTAAELGRMMKEKKYELDSPSIYFRQK